MRGRRHKQMTTAATLTFIGGYFPKRIERIYRTCEARRIWFKAPFPLVLPSLPSLHRVARKETRPGLARSHTVYTKLKWWIKGMLEMRARGWMEWCQHKGGGGRAHGRVHAFFTMLRFRLYCSFDNG